MIHDFKKELKRVKQEICAFVLRHGYQYDGKSKWTIRYMNWIRELEMSEIQRETLNEYIAEMENLNDKINRFMNRIDEMYQSERYHEKVSKLRCFKGIETFAAMTIQVETSDFERFQAQKHMHPILDLQQENILVAIKTTELVLQSKEIQ